MSKIKITCDSTCDLTESLYRENNVDVIPLSVTLGDQVYRDGVDVTSRQLFDYVAQSGTLPMTSAISVGEYLDAWRSYVEDGCDIVHVNISSNLSTSHQNACLAARELADKGPGRVYVVDSQSLSSGSGLLVLEAARLILDGADAAAIKARLDVMREHLDISFVLQTLEYLKKGGRCSSITALGARALQLRPEIRVRNGGMIVGKKYRGNMEKSVLDYIRGRLADRSDIDPARIIITYSSAPDALVEKAVALVKELQPFEEVLVTHAGCTICSHCGPDCLGVLMMTK